MNFNSETETLYKKLVKLDLGECKEVNYGPDFTTFNYKAKHYKVKLSEVKFKRKKT